MTAARTKVLVGFLLAALLTASFLGVVKSDMVMESDGQMALGNCFMPGMTEALCQVNPLEHIAIWQSMFTAVPSQNTSIMLLSLLLALGAFLIACRSIAPPRVHVQQTSFTYYKNRIPIFNPLQEAFSSGILHPKIF